MLSNRKNYYVIRVQTVHYYDKSCKSRSGISAWSVRWSPAVPLEGTGAKELKLSEDNCFPHTKDHRLIKIQRPLEDWEWSEGSILCRYQTWLPKPPTIAVYRGRNPVMREQLLSTQRKGAALQGPEPRPLTLSSALPSLWGILHILSKYLG